MRPGNSDFLVGRSTDSPLYISDSAHHFVVSVKKADWRVNFDSDVSLIFSAPWLGGGGVPHSRCPWQARRWRASVLRTRTAWAKCPSSYWPPAQSKRSAKAKARPRAPQEGPLVQSAPRAKSVRHIGSPRDLPSRYG